MRLSDVCLRSRGGEAPPVTVPGHIDACPASCLQSKPPNTHCTGDARPSNQRSKMDPLDLLGAVLQRPRLDPLAADPPSPQQAGAAASSATHPGAAAYPTTAPHVATGAPRTDAGPPGGGEWLAGWLSFPLPSFPLPVTCSFAYPFPHSHSCYGPLQAAAVMSLVLRLAADLLDRDQPGLLEGALEVCSSEKRGR